ncbi:MAG TPA: hypothetical protein PLZ00_10550 [Mangrovimonas sp.]|nr:hypothetical protein [Mangrovimonas sp.]
MVKTGLDKETAKNRIENNSRTDPDTGLSHYFCSSFFEVIRLKGNYLPEYHRT